MIEIKKHIGEGFGKGELYDTLIQMQLEAGALPISGRTYFVNKLGNNTDGLTWATAFTKIEDAITASNAYHARAENANGRNRILVDGGTGYNETLSVLPNECDIIGVGSSYGRQPRITGVHDITTVVNGCHIFNMYFVSTTAAAIIKLCSDCNGFEIHNCFFQSTGTAATIGIEFGDARYEWVDNCRFGGNPPPLIGIKFDGPFAIMCRITNNYIVAKTTGIELANPMASDYQTIIKDNVICGGDITAPTTQLVYGIDLKDAAGRNHTMMIHNYISAADGIHYENDPGGNIVAFSAIGNIINKEDGSIYETTITRPAEN